MWPEDTEQPSMNAAITKAEFKSRHFRIQITHVKYMKLECFYRGV